MSRVLVLYQGTVVPPKYGTARAVLEEALALAQVHEVTLLHRYEGSVPRGHVVDGSGSMEVVSSFRMPLFYGRFATVFGLLYLPKLIFLCRRRRVEAVLIESVFLAWVGVVLRRVLGVRFGLRSHNLEGDKFRDLGKGGWKRLAAYEAWAHRSADRVFYITEDDRVRARQQFRVAEQRACYLPYVLDTTELRGLRLDPAARKRVRDNLRVAKGQRLLLFYGKLDYAPNVQALDLIERELVPRLARQADGECCILVCGLGLDDARASRYRRPESMIRYVGFVDDINPVIAAADLVLNPVLGGGGVKTKLVEAVALGRPVVSTRSGAKGVDLALCGDAVTVLDDTDWDGFTQALLHTEIQDRTPPATFYEFYSRAGARRVLEQGLGLESDT